MWGKPKAMKFRKGKSLSKTDMLMVQKETIESVNTFTYLGVALSPQLSPTHRLGHLIKRAKWNTFSLKNYPPLKNKINLQKINFASATRLWHPIIVPSGSYGLDIFKPDLPESTIVKNWQRIYGNFWKTWDKAQRSISNFKLLDPSLP